MSSTVPDPNEIMDIERQGCRSLQAGDVDAVIAGCVEDFLQFPQGAALQVGREHFRAGLEQIVATEGYGLSWEPTRAVVSASNDLAYVYGTLKITTPEHGDQAGKYVAVYVKVDGAWKAEADIFNTDA